MLANLYRKQTQCNSLRLWVDDSKVQEKIFVLISYVQSKLFKIHLKVEYCLSLPGPQVTGRRNMPICQSLDGNCIGKLYFRLLLQNN